MILTVTLNPALDLAMDVPNWKSEEVHRARRVQKTAGGKGINVARVLKELGSPATALTILGSDSVQEFKRLAREAALPIIYINIPGEVRTNISIIDPATNAVLKVNQPGTPVLPTYFEHFLLLYRQQLKTARWVSLGGSLPPGLAPDSWGLLARLAAERDVPVLVDSEGQGLLESLATAPALAKPNRRELEVTLGRAIKNEAEMLEGARELLSRGAAAALITNGGEPAVAIDSEGEPWLCHPPRIRPRGTTGAGDAAAAGYIAATIRGAAFTDAIAQALACGAACCVTPETHLVLRRDVERLLPEVRIERLRRAKR